MSDPVTNVDIEDVLSSIRRLVTEEVRDEARKVTRVAEPGSRLLLTPSLRVVDRGPEYSEPQKSPHTSEATSRTTSDHFADVNAIEADELTMSAPSGSASGGSKPETEPADAAATAAKPLVLSEKIQEPSKGVASLTSFDSGKTAEPEMALENFVFSSRHAELRSRSDTLKAKIKALEAAIAETPGPWEPDGSGIDDDAVPVPDALPWRDDVAEVNDASDDHTTREASVLSTEEAEGSGIPADQEPPEVAGPSTIVDDMEAEQAESILDEDTLRQMVAEIVRTELQGVLGERITRNVRKLVRQEIQRALAAQELG